MLVTLLRLTVETSKMFAQLKDLCFPKILKRRDLSYDREKHQAT